MIPYECGRNIPQRLPSWYLLKWIIDTFLHKSFMVRNRVNDINAGVDYILLSQAKWEEEYYMDVL